MQDLSIQELELAILKAFSISGNSVNKYNLLGKPHMAGDLERFLKVEFSEDQRAEARVAFEELAQGEFIRPTLRDIMVPGDWYEITEKGRLALSHNALDELDEALRKIDPHLIDIRRGAWAALASNHPDSLRQAAHSGRELIDQMLKLGAPTEAVKAEPNFIPDATSRDAVTRRMRMKYLMSKHKGSVSNSDLAIAEKAEDLVIAIDDKLMGSAHARSVPQRTEIEDALTAAEIALRNILIG
jgi:hypothetical protein